MHVLVTCINENLLLSYVRGQHVREFSHGPPHHRPVFQKERDFGHWVVSFGAVVEGRDGEFDIRRLKSDAREGVVVSVDEVGGRMNGGRGKDAEMC